MAIDKIIDRAALVEQALNDLSDVTSSSSEPSRTTNPSTGVGTVWLNTTSGELYVCTDATTNANIWTNVGEGTGSFAFPVASSMTSSPSDLSAIESSTTQNITFTNVTDSIDTTFDFAIANISNSTAITGTSAVGSVTGVSSATFAFTIGSSYPQTSTFDVQVTDSDGYTSSKQFTLTTSAPTFSVNYLLVAGGGGGAAAEGNSGQNGGAGAGGMLDNLSTTLTEGVTYTITVGAGGAATDKYTVGNNGANSTITGSGFTTITALGGGGGPDYASDGVSGGSGSGGSESNRSAGQGTSGQGNDGGVGGGYQVGGSGGGGGKGAAGQAHDAGRAGGAGATSAITGVVLAHGGDGSPPSTYRNGTAGGANTGNGADGAGASGSEGSGANGGSGVAALKILTSNYTGTVTGSPTVSTDGSYTIVKYNSTGTYTA
jgi:hypothetical protein